MTTRRRVIALSSLVSGVGLTWWICSAYRVFEPLGPASLVGGLALIVYLPAVLGVIVCIGFLLMDDDNPPRDDSSPTPGSQANGKDEP